jgi:2-methylcitrate dehydratase PrpD
MTDAAHALAAHAAGLRFEAIPARAIARAKVFILDTLGVGIAGSSLPEAAALLPLARGWGDAGAASVWGTRARLSPGAAALVNGYQIHGQEYDCLHEGAVLHAMATLLPVLLAEAETQASVDGRALLTAVVAGVDVACAIGLAARQGWRFFRPATSGGFGAAAGLARLRGYDAARTLAAFGLQLGQASGTMQAHSEGVPLLPLQIGFNARAAIQSCDLAAAGFAGLDAPLEGRFGYLPLYEGAWDCTAVLAALGHRWRVEELSHKPFPSGRATHAGVDAILALRAAHGFGAADIADILLEVPPLIDQLVNRPALPAPGASYARLCLPFVLAKLLLEGEVRMDQFRGAALADPAAYALGQKVRVRRVENPDPNALVPQEVTVTLIDGRVLRHRVETMLASPARPLNRAAQLAKFYGCWAASAVPLGDAAALVALVDGLEDVPDVRALTAAMVAIPRALAAKPAAAWSRNPAPDTPPASYKA